MNAIPQIAVLCNNRMALPAIRALQASGNLCALGVPQKNTELLPFLHDFARQAGIGFAVFGKQNLAADLAAWIKTNAADAVFMMTFPWRIPTETLGLLPEYWFNFHYGLLPEMRGADPVFECIRRQKTETGITVHITDDGMDTGPVVFRHAMPIQPDVTHGLLCTQLSYLGAQLAPVIVRMLAEGAVPKTAQADDGLANYFGKPGLSEVCIDWNTQNASDVNALVRACNPWNKGAYTQWNGWNIRIVGASVAETEGEGSPDPGTVTGADLQKGIRVACKNNTRLHIEYIYTDEGFMPAHKLLAFGLKPHDRFSTF